MGQYSDHNNVDGKEGVYASSPEYGETLNSVGHSTGVAAIEPSYNRESDVTVTFTNKCVATFKVNYTNMVPTAPCNFGFQPDTVTRVSFECSSK